MHESVKNGLKGFEEIASDFEQRSVWLPQFKIGVQNKDEMKSNNQIKNYRLSDGEQPLYVLEYMDQAALQLYAAPMSEGNLIFSVNESKGDILV